jgi:hypothetical protein
MLTARDRTVRPVTIEITSLKAGVSGVLGGGAGPGSETGPVLIT